MWIQAAIGDAQYLGKDFRSAKGSFTAAAVMGGHGNPFVHLRLGQIYFELEDKERAAEHLCLAYMSEGRDLFRDEDPKYLAFLSTVIDPPVGQEEL